MSSPRQTVAMSDPPVVVGRGQVADAEPRGVN
jgi:hypothetical protein